MKYRAMNRAAGIVVLLLMPLACPARDLLTLYRLAQANDPTYDAARHAFDVAKERLPQARAGLLPSLALSASGNEQRGASTFANASAGVRESHAKSWSLQLTQPLYRLANWYALEQADAQVRQAAAQFLLAQQDLMLRSAQAYFDLQVAQESASVAQSQVRAVDQQLVLARRSYAVGTGTITDVHDAQARVDLSRAQAVAARNEVETRRAQVDKLVGADPQALFAEGAVLAALPASAALPTPEPSDRLAWMDRAREEHPSVVGLRAAQEAAEQELNRARAAHLPTLDLSASYGDSDSVGAVGSPADITTRVRGQGQVALQLSMPLFAGGSLQSRVREADAARRKAASELEAMRREVAAQAHQAFAGVVNGLAQADALSSAVISSRNAVEAGQVGLRTGTRIGIDVLNAEQQLYGAERDWAAARYGVLMQGLQLKAAAGTLSVEDLEQVNALLVIRAVSSHRPALARGEGA